MKIRESVGQSVWNHSEGWCCEPLDPIPPGHIALAVEAIALDLVDWDIEEIGEKAGFDIQYKYTGVNDPKDSSLACVSQASRHLRGLLKARSRFGSFDCSRHPASFIQNTD
jgi:hypothetical protein